MPLPKTVLAALLAALLAAHPLTAQEDPPPTPAETETAAGLGEADEAAADAAASADAEGRLPAAVSTTHTIDIGDDTLAFEAVAGSITLTSANGRDEADIAFTAYLAETDDPAARPVTFAVNGGPGAASAYLHLGVLGPWRLPMDGATISPSQSIALEENPETWLAFTDLVFVDPVGTGFSRLVEPDDRLRTRYLSIDGDIEALADFITRWLTQSGRLASPKYFIGESYGGFRGPRLAEALQTDHGIGLSGMTLLSPVLDFGWWQQPDHNPLPQASLLPSLAAAAMERADAYDETRLAEAEAYAAGDFVTDHLRGLADPAAVARVTARVAELTGLAPETVADYAGRFDLSSFTRELWRAEGRIASPYDAGITSLDPTPERPHGRAPDPVLDAMTAPLTSAMLELYRERLGWLPERRYMLLNRGVNRAWSWGGGRGQPESVGALRRVLALDENFRVLVVHGTADLVTPYFASALVLRQLPDFGGRVSEAAYRGGHMFYSRDGSRRAFLADARTLFDTAGTEEATENDPTAPAQAPADAAAE
jgi:carboxypeptidase C (cathepsin A)